MSDFYVIVNSKTSSTHPENNPSDFANTWENNINLQGKWKVGLTQIMRDKPQFKVDDISFAYMQYETEKFHDQITYTEDGSLKLKSKGRPYEVTLIAPNRVKFSWERPFKLYYHSERYGSQGASFHTNINEYYVEDYPFSPAQFTIVSYVSTNKILRSSESGQKWSTYMEFLYFLRQKFPELIDKIKIVRNHVRIFIKEDIYWLRISDELMRILRMEHNDFTNPSLNSMIVLQSQMPVCLDITTAYIYSNICSPMMVGEAYRPLLAITNLETVDIVRPMYVDVDVTKFNTISIKTLAENDAILHYNDTDKVIMTLHFINTSSSS